jgi:hypothetical protein
MPFVRAWSRTYRDDGLQVIGVHTPEFPFEHDLELVQLAVRDRAIEYPVAIDNGFKIWNAFDNRYWPALFFIDTEGIIRGQHFGEGRHRESERLIQRLLRIEHDLVAVTGSGVEAAPDWDHLLTPETYLGYARPQGAISLNGPRDRSGRYAVPTTLPLNHWALGGDWTIGEERVVLNQAGGGIAFRFHARDVHLVMAREERGRVPFHVRLDGRSPGRSHGVDVEDDGSGVLQDGRLYQLVRAHGAIEDHTMQISFDRPGVGAYVFTFG